MRDRREGGREREMERDAGFIIEINKELVANDTTDASRF